MLDGLKFSEFASRMPRDHIPNNDIPINYYLRGRLSGRTLDGTKFRQLVSHANRLFERVCVALPDFVKPCNTMITAEEDTTIGKAPDDALLNCIAILYDLPLSITHITSLCCETLKYTNDCCSDQPMQDLTASVTELSARLSRYRFNSPSAIPTHICDALDQTNKECGMVLTQHVAHPVGHISRLRRTMNHILAIAFPTPSATSTVDRGVLDLLPYETARVGPHTIQTRCSPGSRVHILDMLLFWATLDAASPFLWLKGGTGAGKSVIAATLTERLSLRKDLTLATFFCSAGSTAEIVMSTLIQQIADVDNVFAADVLQHMHKLDPFLASSSSSFSLTRRTVILVDGLDECSRASDLAQLLINIAHTNPLLRVMMTTRPPFPLTPQFTPKTVDLDDQPVEHIQSDTRHELLSCFRYESTSILWDQHSLVERVVRCTKGDQVLSRRCVLEVSRSDTPWLKVEEIAKTLEARVEGAISIQAEASLSSNKENEEFDNPSCNGFIFN